MATKKKFAGNASQREREELAAARARQQGIEPLTPEEARRKQEPEEIKRIMSGETTPEQEAQIRKGVENAKVNELIQTALKTPLPPEELPPVGENLPVGFEEKPNLPFAKVRAAIAGKTATKNLEAEPTTGIGQIIPKLGLNELDIQNIAAGEAKVNALQMTVETIPILGKVSKYIGSLNTPSGRVDTILKQMTEVENQVTDSVTFASANPSAAGRYLKQVDDAQQTVSQLESKIKLLTIQSPQLQGDPEQVILIEEKIIGTKEVIANAKFKISLL